MLGFFRFDKGDIFTDRYFYTVKLSNNQKVVMSLSVLYAVLAIWMNWRCAWNLFHLWYRILRSPELKAQLSDIFDCLLLDVLLCVVCLSTLHILIFSSITTGLILTNLAKIHPWGCLFICLFAWGFTSRSRIIRSYGKVTITD